MYAFRPYSYSNPTVSGPGQRLGAGYITYLCGPLELYKTRYRKRLINGGIGEILIDKRYEYAVMIQGQNLERTFRSLPCMMVVMKVCLLLNTSVSGIGLN